MSALDVTEEMVKDPRHPGWDEYFAETNSYKEDLAELVEEATLHAEALDEVGLLDGDLEAIRVSEMTMKDFAAGMPFNRTLAAACDAVGAILEGYRKV